MAPPNDLATEFGASIRYTCGLTRPAHDEDEDGINFVEEYQLAAPARAPEPVEGMACVVPVCVSPLTEPILLNDTNVNKTWLKRQIQRAFASEDVAVPELCAAVYEVLAGPGGDDALQNALFELLGERCVALQYLSVCSLCFVCRFELIMALLENRSKVVALAQAYLEELQSSAAPKVKVHSGPIIAGQVSIRSQKEKDLMKQMRKEERKAAASTDRTMLLDALGSETTKTYCGLH